MFSKGIIMQHTIIKNGWFEKLPKHEQAIFEESIRTVMNNLRIRDTEEQAVKALQEIIWVASEHRIRLQILT